MLRWAESLAWPIPILPRLFSQVFGSADKNKGVASKQARARTPRHDLSACGSYVCPIAECRGPSPVLIHTYVSYIYLHASQEIQYIYFYGHAQQHTREPAGHLLDLRSRYVFD